MTHAGHPPPEYALGQSRPLSTRRPCPRCPQAHMMTVQQREPSCFMTLPAGGTAAAAVLRPAAAACLLAPSALSFGFPLPACPMVRCLPAEDTPSTPSAASPAAVDRSSPPPPVDTPNVHLERRPTSRFDALFIAAQQELGELQGMTCYRFCGCGCCTCPLSPSLSCSTGRRFHLASTASLQPVLTRCLAMASPQVRCAPLPSIPHGPPAALQQQSARSKAPAAAAAAAGAAAAVAPARQRRLPPAALPVCREAAPSLTAAASVQPGARRRCRPSRNRSLQPWHMHSGSQQPSL